MLFDITFNGNILNVLNCNFIITNVQLNNIYMHDCILQSTVK